MSLYTQLLKEHDLFNIDQEKKLCYEFSSPVEEKKET